MFWRTMRAMAISTLVLLGPRAAVPILSASEAQSSPHAAISGTVFGDDGSPIAAARVELITPGGVITGETVAAGNGEFAIPGVVPGTYFLVARDGSLISRRLEVHHGPEGAGRIEVRFGEVANTARESATTMDREILELRAQLELMRTQQELMARRLEQLSASRAALPDSNRAPDEQFAAAAPAGSKPVKGEVLAAALHAPPVPAPPFPTPFPAPAPAAAAQTTPTGDTAGQTTTAPGRGSTDRGLYQGLAAGAPGQRYGRSLFSDYVRLGGYGSFRYEANNIDLGPQVGDLPQLRRGHNGFDFRRFVMTMDASPFDKLRFYMELEFERLNEIEIERNAIPENRGRADRNRRGTRFIQEVEGTSGGEIAMEQAWMEYQFNPNLAARMGVILPPVGRYNILHDDDYWDIARRPLAVRGGPVAPASSAWREMGAGLVFSKAIGDGFVDAQFYVVNGVQLDFTVEEVVALREGRNLVELEPEIAFSSGAFDGSQSADAVTWKLNLSPKLGHEFGISGYHGNYTPDYLLARGKINTLAFDGKTTLGNFEMEGEFIHTRFGNFRNVLNDIALQMVDVAAATSSSETSDIELETEAEFSGPFTKSRKGFWLDFKYRTRPDWLRKSFLGKEFEDAQIIPIIRWERIWFDDFVNAFEFENSGITNLETENLSQERLTFGVAYRPAPSVVFTTAWEHNRRLSGGRLISPRPVGTDPLFDRSFDAFTLGATFGF